MIWVGFDAAPPPDRASGKDALWRNIAAIAIADPLGRFIGGKKPRIVKRFA